MKKLLIVSIKVRRKAELWEAYESRAYTIPFNSTGVNADKMDTNDLMEYAHTLDVLSLSVPGQVNQMLNSDWPREMTVYATQDDLDSLGLTSMQVEINTRFEKAKP